MADNENKFLERLIQLYENKSKNFEKYFAILMGISLFIFFFMLFPYVYLQTMEKNLSAQLDLNKKNLLEKENDAILLNETREKIAVGNQTFNNQLDILSNEFVLFYNYLIGNKSNDIIRMMCLKAVAYNVKVFMKLWLLKNVSFN